MGNRLPDKSFYLDCEEFLVPPPSELKNLQKTLENRFCDAVNSLFSLWGVLLSSTLEGSLLTGVLLREGG